ncbi:M56 family metallopeptidase [Eubacteriales bacterium OttesenSCG-928-A19]|nr:M56 family metallopeptidase [Eubacteriales bacterium OttesenSCG-928-A19]
MTQFMRAMLECTVTMSVAALALMALSPLLTQRYSSRSVYIAWLIILAGLVIPFRPQPAPAVVTVTLPRQQAVMTAAQPQTQAAQPPQAPQPQEDATPPALQEVQPSPAYTPQAASSPRAWTPGVEEIVLMAWLAGALTVLSIRLYGHWRFMRTVRRWSRPVRDPYTCLVLARAREAVGASRPVMLKCCRSVDSPMVVGLFRPVILLPDMTLSPEALRLVLTHELVHLRRGDLWGRALLLAASSMHWFNPLMPLIAQAVSFHCEAACDAEVMRGMDLDARQRYGETILQTIRARTSVHTALSTRYHGGIHMMKRRILGIMDTRRKRIGALVVAFMLAAVLGAGMAFALNPAQAAVTREVSYERDWLVTQATEDDQRLQALALQNDRLSELINEYESDVAMKYPYYEILRVRPGYGTDTVLRAIDACKDTDDVLAMLDEDFVMMQPRAPEGLDAAADAVLADAGFSSMTGRVVEKNMQNIVYPVAEPAWIVYAWEAPREDGSYSAVAMEFSNDLVLMRMFPERYPDKDSGVSLTDRQRSMARERAVTFAGVYGKRAEGAENVTYVADNAYTGMGAEPYTFVWVFSWSYGDDAERMPSFDTTHQTNDGVELCVGVRTGRIYSMSQYQQGEASFVNYTPASVDWIDQTGLDYPFIDSNFVQDNIAPMIQGRLNELLGVYRDELTDEERLQLWGMFVDGGLSNSLELDTDWEKLEEDVNAVNGVEDLKRVLSTDYAGITEARPGETPRAEYEAKVDGVLEALGYTDMPLRAFKITRNHTSGENFQILACAEPPAEDNRGPLGALTLDMAPDGRLFSVNGTSYSTYHMREHHLLTDAEREAATARALEIANALCVAVEEPVDTVRLADFAVVSIGEEPVVMAWVPHTTQTYTSNDGEVVEERYGVQLSLGVESGRVYYMYSHEMEQQFDRQIDIIQDREEEDTKFVFETED